VIVGFYLDASFVEHGFLRANNGIFTTTIECPSSNVQISRAKLKLAAAVARYSRRPMQFRGMAQQITRGFLPLLDPLESTTAALRASIQPG
jgi:hypothetical protein